MNVIKVNTGTRTRNKLKTMILKTKQIVKPLFTNTAVYYGVIIIKNARKILFRKYLL